MSNWILTMYETKEIETFVIENRTENEATKEAESIVEQVSNCDDWTLIEESE